MRIYEICEHPKIFEQLFSDVQEPDLEIEVRSGVWPYDMESVLTQILRQVSPRKGQKFEITVGECDTTDQDTFVRECVAALRNPSSYITKR